MIAELGPLPCVACHRPVLWQRIADRWWLGEVTANELRHHHCRPRCHARMGTESCERLAGHAGTHSRRSTLDHRAAWMRASKRAPGALP